jgi:hypothetical protein
MPHGNLRVLQALDFLMTAQQRAREHVHLLCKRQEVAPQDSQWPCSCRLSTTLVVRQVAVTAEKQATVMLEESRLGAIGARTGSQGQGYRVELLGSSRISSSNVQVHPIGAHVPYRGRLAAAAPWWRQLPTRGMKQTI